jgi:hypothetical protein
MQTHLKAAAAVQGRSAKPSPPHPLFARRLVDECLLLRILELKVGFI